MSSAWPWIAVALLGAFHGLNPAMGWLFAVSLGLQERRRNKVLAALPPIAVGHLLSVAAVVAVVAGAGLLLPIVRLRQLGAVLIVMFGLLRLFKPGLHPRWVNMRVNGWQLGLWSFLMATAHGAGLMLFPILVATPICSGFRYVSFAAGPEPSMVAGSAVVLVHTAAMLAVMGTIAVLVYDWLGLAFLRSAWINLDWIWGGALITAGVIVLLI